jgi:predicted ribosomally synthesized peptide with nif11-like leader
MKESEVAHASPMSDDSHPVPDVSLQAFIAAIRRDPGLQERLSTTAAADADEVAAIARAAGFDLHPDDLVSHAAGALVEYTDEDWFLKPRWWDLNP